MYRFPFGTKIICTNFLSKLVKLNDLYKLEQKTYELLINAE